MTAARYFLGFSGRINRAKWWLFLILSIAYELAVYYFIIPLRIPYVAWIVVMAPLWYAAIAVGVKRLHDRNKPAVWALLFYALPIAIWAYGDYTAWKEDNANIALDQARVPEDVQAATQAIQEARQGRAAQLGSLGWVLFGTQVVIVIWATIELGLLKGTAGDNPYGPDPVAGHPAHAPA